MFMQAAMVATGVAVGVTGVGVGVEVGVGVGVGIWVGVGVSITAICLGEQWPSIGSQAYPFGHAVPSAQ